MTDLRTTNASAAGEDKDVDQGRRSAMAKMGGIAAPAFVMLLTADASEAWAASGPVRPRPGRPKPPPRPRPPRPRVVLQFLTRFF